LFSAFLKAAVRRKKSAHYLRRAVSPRPQVFYFANGDPGLRIPMINTTLD